MPRADPPDHASAPERSPPAETESVVGRLDADRLCPRCLHQLSGQVVLREPRTELLFVRCPECGISAAVTEHPWTGRWLRRLGGFVAGILVLILLALLAMDVFASTIAILASGWDAVRSFEGPLQTAGAALGPANPNTWSAPPELWKDPAALAAIGADPEARDAAWVRLRWAALPTAAVGLASGTLWTILLAHRRWSVAWLWLFVPQLLAVCFALVTHAMHDPATAGAFVTYGNLAFSEYGLPFLASAALVLFVARLGSFFLMRPLVLFMAKALLPPKLHRAVRSVWSDDPVPERSTQPPLP